MLILSSGCVEVKYGMHIKGNDSVVKEYNVIIDPEANFGPYNAEYALEVATFQLESMLGDDEYGEIIVNEENEYDISLIFTYSSMNEYYRSMGITGNEPPEPDDSVTDKEFLFTETTINVFSDLDQEFVNNYINDIRLYAFPQIVNVPYYDIIINLEYGTPYTKAYTANTPNSEVIDNTRVFTWTMNATQAGNTRQIVIRQPNYVNWYLMAIASSLVVTAILYVALNILRKNKHGRQEDTI